MPETKLKATALLEIAHTICMEKSLWQALLDEFLAVLETDGLLAAELIAKHDGTGTDFITLQIIGHFSEGKTELIRSFHIELE